MKETKMVIAVEIRFSEDHHQNFIYQSFKRITAQHPQYSFIFIFDKAFEPSFIFSENVTAIVVKAQNISLLTDLKISSLLKKYKADVLVTAKYLSQTKVPQCLVACDKLKLTSLKKAVNIITDSEFSKKEIIENYKINGDKSDNYRIDVVYKGVDEIFQPVTFEQKEKVKEKYTSGNEYFLYAGTTFGNDLLNLLKAFSSFKKMQKSNMQLLIAIKTNPPKEFLETLRLFKFKSEVQILDVSKNELAAVTASAYAFVYPFAKGYLYALQAMRSGVPVITSNAGYMPEICGDAALYFDHNDHKKIADKMMLVHKDENLRQQLIDKGRDRVKKYSWDNSADSLWKCIEKACW